MQPWIKTELGTAHLGDRRLDERAKIVLERLSEHPSASIPAACRSRAEYEAAYRLFDNERVDERKILEPHCEATVRRIANYPVVYVIQDTSELDLTRPRERVGGPLDEDKRWGLLDHALLAATPKGLALGVVGAEIWARRPKKFRTNWARDQRAYCEKESYRWFLGYERCCEVARQVGASTCVIMLADSEGDIYECLAAAISDAEQYKAHFIVRAYQDRKLVGRTRRLFEVAQDQPVIATRTVSVRARPARSFDGLKRKRERTEREAVVSIKTATVRLSAPLNCKKQTPDGLVINIVYVREKYPPQDQVPLEWLLLTDLPIQTVEQVSDVIDGYKIRWTIEDYFKVLKSGCGVEEIQLETTERAKNCVALYMIVAWRVLFLTRLSRTSPDSPCDEIFDDAEWKSVYVITQQQPPPDQPPSLHQMVHMIASLGGFLGRKGDGEPGTKSVWIGVQRMKDFAIAWEQFGPSVQQL